EPHRRSGGAHNRDHRRQRQAGGGRSRRRQERRLRRHGVYARLRDRSRGRGRPRRGEGRAGLHRSQGHAVPAGDGDGLRGNAAILGIHLQESEPDRRVRLWRKRAAAAGRSEGTGGGAGWRLTSQVGASTLAFVTAACHRSAMLDTQKSLTIVPPRRPLNGRVTPPGSKSITNRALLLAALARGTSRLSGALKSQDTALM